jgi:hypothetical protein
MMSESDPELSVRRAAAAAISKQPEPGGDRGAGG